MKTVSKNTTEILGGVMRPNLFKYATSELSQDALICYVLSFYSKGLEVDNKLEYEFAKNFLKKLLEESLEQLKSLKDEKMLKKLEKLEEIIKKLNKEHIEVEIKKQFLKIDVLLIIDKDVYVIIEDKTFTSEGKNQINGYIDKLIKNIGNIESIKNANEENIYSIYYKTGDESFQNIEDKKKQQITTILSDQIIEIFKGYKGNNIIFQDYLFNLLIVKKKKEAFKDRNLLNSYFKEEEIIGFYHELDKKFQELKAKDSDIVFNWHYVSNPSGGFICYYFSTMFNFKKFDYFFQIEASYDSSEEYENSKVTIVDSSINEISEENNKRLKLVLKLWSEEKNSELLPIGLEILPEKWKEEKKFYTLSFRKGLHMTQGIVKNFIVLHDTGTINVEETAKEILKNIKEIKKLKDKFLEIENK